MVLAPGVFVSPQEAEPTRRQLMEAGILRDDLAVARAEGLIGFPVTEAGEWPVREHDFSAREARVERYQDLLPESLQADAPRAYDRLGDIIVVKVPPAIPDRAAIGRALLAFHGNVRAVFHDAGVVGVYRTRALERIAGEGDSTTTLTENGVRLRIDPARAYYSPRLATERARIVAMLEPGMHVVDLFGGVAPLGVQAAKAGATVDTVDLNPDAAELAEFNVAENRVGDHVTVYCGDAHAVAESLDGADHVVMNLPHGAFDFLDAAARVVKPGGWIHYHEILEDDRLKARIQEVTERLAELGVDAEPSLQRHVRTYATGTSHWAMDFGVVA